MFIELYILDLIGTFTFAIYGSYFALEKDFDLFGICVCAFLTAFGGGTIRDIILRVDPFYFSDMNYIVVTVLAIIFTIFIYKKFATIKKTAHMFDSIGLVTFAFIGAAKAQSFGLGIFAITFFATLTAVGGGIMRDVIMNKVPEIMYRDFYATVAVLLGISYGFLHTYMDDLLWANILLSIFLIVRLGAELFHIRLWRPKK